MEADSEQESANRFGFFWPLKQACVRLAPQPFSSLPGRGAVSAIPA
jgi:hypothetical protein